MTTQQNFYLWNLNFYLWNLNFYLWNLNFDLWNLNLYLWNLNFYLWNTLYHNWHETIFSDKKRFSLDGPDNWMSYIAKNEENSCEKRQCKGGGLMVWLIVMLNGLLSHKIIERKFCSKDYLSLLKTSIVAILKLNYGANFFFQEDNCSVQKSQVVQYFMFESKIKVLERPAKSPDLNIVENIWEQLSKDIYDGSQFKKKCQLIERINETIYHFNSMKRNQIMSLYDTTRQRLCTVLLRNGNICN